MIGKVTNQSTAFLSADEISLFKAAAGRNVSLIRFFINRGVNVNTLDEERTSILHVAARHGSIPVVEELIQCNANLNLTDMAGWTPLHVSAFFQRPQVCLTLLQAGALATIRSRDGQQAYDLVRDKMTQEVFKNQLIPQPLTEEQDIYGDRVNRQRETAQEQYDLYFRNLKHRLSNPRLSLEVINQIKADLHQEAESDQSPSVFSSPDALSLPILVQPAEAIAEFNYPTPLMRELSIEVAQSNPILSLAFAILTHCMKPSVEDAVPIIKHFHQTQLGALFLSPLAEGGRLMDAYLSATPYEADDYVRSLRGFFALVACENDPFQVDCLVQGLSRHLIRHFRNHPFKSEQSLHMFTFAVVMLDIELNEKRGKLRPLEECVQDFIANIQGINDGQNYQQNFINHVIDEIRRLRITNIQRHGQGNLDAFRARLGTQFPPIRMIKSTKEQKRLWEFYCVEQFFILVREDKIVIVVRQTVKLECPKEVVLRAQVGTITYALSRQSRTLEIKRRPMFQYRLANPQDGKRLIALIL